MKQPPPARTRGRGRQYKRATRSDVSRISLPAGPGEIERLLDRTGFKDIRQVAFDESSTAMTTAVSTNPGRY
jgi:hypothetical protein